MSLTKLDYNHFGTFLNPRRINSEPKSKSNEQCLIWVNKVENKLKHDLLDIKIGLLTLLTAGLNENKVVAQFH